MRSFRQGKHQTEKQLAQKVNLPIEKGENMKLFLFSMVLVISNWGRAQMPDLSLCQEKMATEMKIDYKEYGLWTSNESIKLKMDPGFVVNIAQLGRLNSSRTQFFPASDSITEKNSGKLVPNSLDKCKSRDEVKSCFLKIYSVIMLIDDVRNGLITSSETKIHNESLMCARTTLLTFASRLIRKVDLGYTDAQLGPMKTPTETEISTTMARLESVKSANDAKVAADTALSIAIMNAATASTQAGNSTVSSGSTATRSVPAVPLRAAGTR